MTDKHLEPNDLDGLIIRELSRLPPYQPSRGFATRVMTQVRLPEPTAVTAFRRARAWVLQPRRAVALAGAYAACAVVALGFAVPWLVQHSAAIAAGAQFAGTRLLGSARQLGMDLAGWVFTSPSWNTLRAVPVLRDHFVPLLALLTAAYAGAGVALHQLLKAPGGKRVPIARSL